jgi:hypothetical protein
MLANFAEQEHIYRHPTSGAVVPSVTEVLRDGGFIDTSFFTEEGRDRGSRVHEACHLHDFSKLGDDLPDDIRGRVEAYQRFLDETGFEVYYSEISLIDPARMYGGTPDKIGRFPDDSATTFTVLDLKSGRPSAWVALQLGGYKPLAWQHLNETGLKAIIIRRFALELKDDGTYRLSTEFRGIDDTDTFYAALRCLQWKRNN